jgi:glycosyltransferase involved in cell wall biosynthesis
MARRRVLVLPAWYPSERDPLWGIFVREQARAVASQADVAVLHVEWAWPRGPRPIEIRDAEEDGIRTVRVRVLRAPGVALLGPELAGYAAGVRRLRRSGFTPDVIHAHVFRAGLHAVLLGRAAGSAVVVSEHYSAFPRGLLRPWERLVARRAFSAAEIVAPVSDNLRRHIEAYGMRARFRVVPNAVDERLFAPPAGERAPGPPRLLVVASLIPLKGVHRVLAGLAALASRGGEAHLDVVGEGPERASLEGLARELGIAERVSFHGRRPREEVAGFLQRADLLVMASEWENLPSALLEAQVAGLPAVAPAVGGIPEVLTEASGVPFDPQDEDALAEALDRAVSDLGSFDRAAIARAARDRYGTAAVAARWSEVYSEAEGLARRRRRVRMRAARSR